MESGRRWVRRRASGSVGIVRQLRLLKPTRILDRMISSPTLASTERP